MKFLGALLVLVAFSWADNAVLVDENNGEKPHLRVARSSSDPISYKPEKFGYIVSKYNRDYCGSEVCSGSFTMGFGVLKHFYLWGNKEEFVTYMALCCEMKEKNGKPELTGINRCCAPHISDRNFDHYKGHCCGGLLSDGAKCCAKQGIFGKGLLSFNGDGSYSYTRNPEGPNGPLDYGIYCCRNGINMCCDGEKELAAHLRTGWPI